MPELLWNFEGKKIIKKFTTKETTLGSGDCDIRIPSKILPEKAMKFYELDGIWWAENIGNVEIVSNGGRKIAPLEKKMLGDKALFSFGSLSTPGFLVFLYTNSEDFSNVKIISQQFENEKLLQESNLLLIDFWKNFKPTNLSPYAIFNYVVGFFCQKFQIGTAMLYENVSGCWKGRAGKFLDTEASKYEPSHYLLKKCVSEKTAVSITRNEVNEKDLSQSIIQNNIKVAFLFPVKFGQDICGVLWLDSKENSLTSNDFFRINHLLESGIASFARIGFEYLSLVKKEEQQHPKQDTPGVPVKIENKPPTEAVVTHETKIGTKPPNLPKTSFIDRFRKKKGVGENGAK